MKLFVADWGSSINKWLDAPYFYNRWVVLAVVVTLINDRFLKHALPGIITGKLSDFSGLFFFAIFLTYILHRGLSFKYSENSIRLSCLITGFLFIIFKYIDLMRNGLSRIFAEYIFEIQIAEDLSDLIALISLVMAYRFLRRFRVTAA